MKLIFYLLLTLLFSIIVTKEDPNMSTWTQKRITLSAKRRGCYLVTDEVLSHIRSELSEYKCGVRYKNKIIYIYYIIFLHNYI